ncbi:unnamed protein product, partial [Mesorhabditis spiculigera]
MSGRPKRANAGKRSLADDDYSTPVPKPRRETITPPTTMGLTGKVLKPRGIKGRPRKSSPAGSTASSSSRLTAETPKMPPPKAAAASTRSKKSRKKRDYTDYYSEAEDTEEESDVDDLKQSFDEDVLEDEREDLDLGSIDVEDEEDDIAPWASVDPEDLPELILPESSQDLKIPEEHILAVTELHNFYHVYAYHLQISPCLFEDFCTALVSESNSLLLAELHLSLLRLIWREDDEKHVQCSEKETIVCWNLLTQIVDQHNYAEVLRLYIQADQRYPQDLAESIKTRDYPFSPVSLRLEVLQWLQSCFLQSAVFKQIIKEEGKIMSESTCRACGKLGDIVMCDSCDASYHVKCLQKDQQPNQDKEKENDPWYCPICTKERCRGLSDCLPFGVTADKCPIRIPTLGKDRHARIYWFIARRIFVHDPEKNAVHYYSTLPQIHELLSRLDGELYEKDLMATFDTIHIDIIEQMSITVELTNERRMERVQVAYAARKEFQDAVLSLDNANRAARILSTRKEEGMAPIVAKLEPMMGLSEGKWTSPFWIGNLEAPTFCRETGNGPDLLANGYRLGFDDLVVFGYVNYRNDDLAKPHAQRKREADRKKYLSMKFSFDEFPFKWVEGPSIGQNYNKASTFSVLKETMIKLQNDVPIELFHRHWPGYEPLWLKGFDERNVRCLREALMQLECGLRKPLFLQHWWNGIGTTRFLRTTQEDRDERSKTEEQRRKLEKALALQNPDETDDLIWVQFAKLGGLPKHKLWNLRDEQYRLNGKGALGGWAWVGKTYQKRYVPTPIYSKEEMINGLDIKPSKGKPPKRIADVLKKLVKWRDTEEDSAVSGITNNAENWRCKSPSCPENDEQTLELNGGVKTCSTPKCREIKAEEEDIEVDIRHDFIIPAETICSSCPGIVVAKDPLQQPSIVAPKVLGEEEPFPLPKPFSFQRSNGTESLLALPYRYLKILARHGGLNPAFFCPGFSRAGKSNMHAWNYPCARPQYELCWKWATQHAKSMQVLGLYLRILHACIRWGDMQTVTDEEEKHKRFHLHLDDRDETRIVIGHKEMPPDGYYERYQVQVDITMVDDDDDDGADAGSSSRSRKKRSMTMKRSDLRARGPKRSETRWIDGVDLKLWEITAYWRKKNGGKPGGRSDGHYRPQPISRQATQQQGSAMSLRHAPRPKPVHSPVDFTKPRNPSTRSETPRLQPALTHRGVPVASTSSDTGQLVNKLLGDRLQLSDGRVLIRKRLADPQLVPRGTYANQQGIVQPTNGNLESPYHPPQAKQPRLDPANDHQQYHAAAEQKPVVQASSSTTVQSNAPYNLRRHLPPQYHKHLLEQYDDCPELHQEAEDDEEYVTIRTGKRGRPPRLRQSAVEAMRTMGNQQPLSKTPLSRRQVPAPPSIPQPRVQRVQRVQHVQQVQQVVRKYPPGFHPLQGQYGFPQQYYTPPQYGYYDGGGYSGYGGQYGTPAPIPQPMMPHYYVQNIDTPMPTIPEQGELVIREGRPVASLPPQLQQVQMSNNNVWMARSYGGDHGYPPPIRQVKTEPEAYDGYHYAQPMPYLQQHPQFVIPQPVKQELVDVQLQPPPAAGDAQFNPNIEIKEELDVGEMDDVWNEFFIDPPPQ